MIRAPQDFLAGLFFLAAGGFLYWAGWNLPTGTASRMAQGYFPNLLAGALCLVGAVIMGRALAVRGAPAPALALRPLLPLIGVVAFGLLVRTTGLGLATLAVIVFSVLGSDHARFRDAVALALVLIPFNWLVFIKGLGLPLSLWPEF